jgi:uncharacterized repeat protein (TIGR03803 family)
MQFFQSLLSGVRSSNRRRRSGAAWTRVRLGVEELESRVTPSLVSTSFVAPYGIDPYGNLLMDSSGNLYGTAALGGTYGNGTVFELTHGSSTLTTLAAFNGSNGANPHSSLVMDSSGNLYGTSVSGGTANDGTVFELANGSSTITTLANFTGANGANPYAGLVMDPSGNLYGTTANGGAANDGTVFELAAGSGTITTLASFNCTNGANPLGVLTLDSQGNLYGTANLGGASNHGTVFELAAGSSTITTVASFNGTNGSGPVAGLIMDGSGNLYGTAANGGAYNNGTVFKVVHGSGAITALASFQHSTTGANPQGSLVMDASGNLYGTTENGPVVSGVTWDGTVFELAAGSSTITTLTSFRGIKGEYPMGGLVMDASSNLYGTTQGFTGQPGTVFELAPASSTFTVLARFDYPSGKGPIAGVVMDSSGNVYGPAGGGSANDGVVFEQAAGSGTITPLASFNGTNGSGPGGGMVMDASGNLYGMTSGGGASNDGTVFEIAHASGTITTLASFNGINWASPPSGLLMDGSGNLYGTTTYGGASNDGTVFEVAAGSNTITTLASFTGGNEAYPLGNLLMDGQGNLYGTTQGASQLGGYSGYGAVFELAAGSHTITTLATFSATTSKNGKTTSDNGRYPQGGLVMDSHGDLYGTTANGGASGDGTIFEVVAGSGKATTVVTFNGSNGNDPQGGLIMDRNGNMYGTTFNGGAANDGIVFELPSGSSTVSVLASFGGANGSGPAGSLFMDSRGNLWGTTMLGGNSNLGTVFELTAGSSPAPLLGASSPAGPAATRPAAAVSNLPGTDTPSSGQGSTGVSDSVFANGANLALLQAFDILLADDGSDVFSAQTAHRH